MIEFTYCEIGVTLAIMAFLTLLLILTIHIVKTLSNVNKTLINVNNLIETNRSNIDSTIKTFPEICENINDVTLSLKEKTDLFDHLFSSDKETETSDLENIMAIASTAIEFISGFTGKFGKKKKRLFTKK